MRAVAVVVTTLEAEEAEAARFTPLRFPSRRLFTLSLLVQEAQAERMMELVKVEPGAIRYSDRLRLQGQAVVVAIRPSQGLTEVPEAERERRIARPAREQRDKAGMVEAAGLPTLAVAVEVLPFLVLTEQQL